MRNRIGSDRPAVVIGCDRLWLVVIGCDRENARTILAFATACHDWKVWLSFLLGLWDLSRGRLPWAFVGICFSCFNRVLLANPCPVPWCHAIAWTKFLGRVSANQRPDSPRCQLLPISTEGIRRKREGGTLLECVRVRKMYENELCEVYSVCETIEC